MWVSYHVLRTLLGKNVADALCKAKGGVPFYVPMHVNSNHELVQVIGPHGLAALCSRFRGEQITIPSGRVRKEAVITALEEGKSKRQVARECGVSLRWVCKVADMCGTNTEKEPLTLLDLVGKCD